MAEWSKNKVEPSNINNGQEYTLNDNVSLEELNAIVNNSLYITDVADTANANSQKAVSTSNTALGTAEEALNTSNTASNTANSAKDTATEALNTANTAISTSNTALGKSTTAEEKATSAVSVSGQANTKADNAVSTSNNALQNSQTAISTANTAVSTANYAEEVAQNALDGVTGKYVKPASGIPKSDLDSGVQASLNKADTALQSHQDISSKANLSGGNTFSGTQNISTGESEYSINADGYVKGSWGRFPKTGHQSATSDKVCTLDASGWVYYRTPSELISDGGGAKASDIVQSDWNETDTLSKAYIKNKPDISEVAKLYSETGQNTDGAMTQKAVTNEIQFLSTKISTITETGIVIVDVDGTEGTISKEVGDLLYSGKAFMRYTNETLEGSIIFKPDTIVSQDMATLSAVVADNASMQAFDLTNKSIVVMILNITSDYATIFPLAIPLTGSGIPATYDSNTDTYTI